MTIREEFIPKGHPNRPGIKLETRGALPLALVFHYTANDAPRATDTMNARYFGRDWHKNANGDPVEWTTEYRKDKDGRTIIDPETGKPKLFKVEIPFRYGSAQVVVDEDSITIAIPTDEAAWACGDRNAAAWTPEWKGQRPLARNLFGNRQNYQTVSIEICNNGDWPKAVDLAAEYAAAFIRNRGLLVLAEQSARPGDRPMVAAGGILLLRHWDITGKVCPKPFMGDNDAWPSFVYKIAGMTRE